MMKRCLGVRLLLGLLSVFFSSVQAQPSTAYSIKIHVSDQIKINAVSTWNAIDPESQICEWNEVLLAFVCPLANQRKTPYTLILLETQFGNLKIYNNDGGPQFMLTDDSVKRYWHAQFMSNQSITTPCQSQNGNYDCRLYSS